MITIDARVLGKRAPLVPQWQLPCPQEFQVEGETLTLRALITGIVRIEVDAFGKRQAERRLLQVLTTKQISDGVVVGKIIPGGQNLNQEVDPEEAVASALQAFDDGFYLVIVDGKELRSLDQQVCLRSDSRLTFLRLAMLVGG